MKVLEFIWAVKQALNVQSDDSTVSDRMVYFTGKGIRSALLRQEANKDLLWDGANAQVIPDFELRRSTVSESDCFDADTVVFKSANELPELVDTKFGKIILGVYFDNGSRLQKTEYVHWLANQKRRYKLPTTTASYFIRNNRLYVIGYDTLPECISVFVEAVLDSPEVVLNECDFIGDMEFQMPSYLIDRTVRMTAELIRGKYIIAADTSNNAREDAVAFNPKQ